MSVVVPFYNVGQHLAQCVESILNQTAQDLEIILVDDGSTDVSSDIAAHFAATQPRVTVLTQRNAGPGGARNLGVASATGTYLTFVDSDDRLPLIAIEALLRSAQPHDADIVVGAIGRFNATRSWLPEWSKDTHSRVRNGIRLEQFPALLRNNYPVGKLYRRQFWTDQKLAFEEGVIFEDQPLISQMLVRAEHINVLTDIVYHYRQREDRSSISQRPEELRDLEDRAAAWRRSLDVMIRESSTPVVSAWYDTIYNTHLHWYLNNDSIGDHDYWQTLRNAFTELRRHEPSSTLGELTAEKRTALLLLDADRQADMIDFREAGGYNLYWHSSRVTPDGPEYDLPLSAEALACLPDQVAVSPVSSLSLRQSLLRGGWDNDGDRLILGLAGHAYIPGLDLAENPTTINVFARNPSGGTKYDFNVHTSTDRALVPPETGDIANYDAAAYDAFVDLADLDPGTPRLELFVTVTTGPYTVTEPLRNLSSRGGLGEAGCRMRRAQHRVRLVAGSNRQVGLQILTEKPRAIVEHLTMRGRELTVTFLSTGSDGFSTIHLDADGLASNAVADVMSLGSSRYEATTKLPPLTAGLARAPSVVSWTVRARSTSGTKVALSWSEGRRQTVPAGTGTVRAHGSAVGNLKLEEYPYGGILVTDLLMASASILKIEAQTMLADGHSIERFEAGSRSGDGIPPGWGTATAVASWLDLSNLDFDEEDTVQLTAVIRNPDGRAHSIPVVLGEGALAKLPMAPPGTSLRLERSKGRTLALHLVPARQWATSAGHDV